MKYGELELFSLSDGLFALDGGAMFGVVPRVFWQKTNPPDERNRITLALRPLLVKTSHALALVDTGIGDKDDAKFQDIYRVEHKSRLVQSLAQVGFRPEDVTLVINTHLHFDHAGGNTLRGGSGAIRPTFPNAKYFIQEKEWEMAARPDVRSRASYRTDNYAVLKESGQLVLVHGDQEITPGVSVLHTGGHTGGHQSVLVRSQGKIAVYWGDLIPTVSHINVPYVMGYDTLPLQTIEQKERLLKLALAENWLMFFEHDPGIACGYLREECGRYSVKPLQVSDIQAQDPW